MENQISAKPKKASRTQQGKVPKTWVLPVKSYAAFELLLHNELRMWIFYDGKNYEVSKSEDYVSYPQLDLVIGMKNTKKIILLREIYHVLWEINQLRLEFFTQPNQP